MPTNYTPNYQLNQWERSDAVRRVDFNADNARIDAAIAAVAAQAGSKASASELNSLRSTVNSLSSTVSGQGYSLGRKGNCQVEVTSYTGDGNSSRTHTFSRKPVLVMVFGSSACILALQGMTQVLQCASGSNSLPDAAWSGTKLTLSHSGTGNHAYIINNESNRSYRMLVLYNMSE